MLSDKVFTGRLENWVVTPLGTKGSIVWGDLYEDVNKRWCEGENIRTSLIIEINEAEGWVQTRNSLYKLGQKLARR